MARLLLAQFPFLAQQHRQTMVTGEQPCRAMANQVPPAVAEMGHVQHIAVEEREHRRASHPQPSAMCERLREDRAVDLAEAGGQFDDYGLCIAGEDAAEALRSQALRDHLGMASALAFSPAACPPRPSATTASPYAAL